MKFAREYQAALQREGFPEDWINASIPYRPLKKLVNQVAAQLQSVGLDPKTLRELLASSHDQQAVVNQSGAGAVALEYQNADNRTPDVPKLTLYIELENGVATNASLSHKTRRYLEGLANQHLNPSPSESSSRQASLIPSNDLDSRATSVASETQSYQRIEIPLAFNVDFFDHLQGDVSALEALQAQEQKLLNTKIANLSQVVAKVTEPSKKKHGDLRQWQQLFDMYLEAEIFFSPAEANPGRRTTSEAIKRLQQFQDDIHKKAIFKAFKLRASREALEVFLGLNQALFSNLKYQEINQQAIKKITKKYDKHTALETRETFANMISKRHMLIPETMAKAVCASISTEIIKLVPRLDDYLCPVCYTITYKPIRLACNHIFCIRCLVVLQRDKKPHCPLCRENVVMRATTDNIDVEMKNYLELYFPKETKTKQIENEHAAGVDKYGPAFESGACVIM